jgi:hypothetical protein
VGSDQDIADKVVRALIGNYGYVVIVGGTIIHRDIECGPGPEVHRTKINMDKILTGTEKYKCSICWTD